MRASEGACRLSIRLLFAERQTLLFKSNLPAVEGCYLWTFTFPDHVPARIAAERFRRATHHWKRSGKVGVRVLEQGDNGERRFHYHVVTCQRWSHATMVRELAPYGFGFLFAIEVPKEKLEYIAKYVGKKPSLGASRLRRWGCIGFDGVSTQDVLFTEKVCINTDTGPLHEPCEFVRWSCGLYGAITHCVRSNSECEPVTRNMELKPAQVKELLADITAGLIVFVGEYRGYSVRKLDLLDKKNPALTIPRVIVEHNVEVNGEARQVSEWLPVGASAESVKPAAARGDVVKVVVESLRYFGGKLQASGAIKPLVQLHL